MEIDEESRRNVDVRISGVLSIYIWVMDKKEMRKSEYI